MFQARAIYRPAHKRKQPVEILQFYQLNRLETAEGVFSPLSVGQESIAARLGLRGRRRGSQRFYRLLHSLPWSLLHLSISCFNVITASMSVFSMGGSVIGTSCGMSIK